MHSCPPRCFIERKSLSAFIPSRPQQLRSAGNCVCWIIKCNIVLYSSRLRVDHDRVSVCVTISVIGLGLGSKLRLERIFLWCGWGWALGKLRSVTQRHECPHTP